MIDGRRHVVFDLDGTLTVAVHDFAAMKRALDLPPELPILEALAGLDPPERRARRARLDAIEAEIAGRGQAAPGARELLEHLRGGSRRVGIVTRNTKPNAALTLRAAGLDGYFDEADIVGRDEVPAKPAPDGIHYLLRRWSAQPADAMMVGDYRFDLEAGRAAGVMTVLVRAGPAPDWGRGADVYAGSLVDLLEAAARG
ncbi:MAG: HAD family hydrolase [Myxococcales bacterium FL481]|nr:MAG: HAD family hydrolase [Myxococcales bacterium FL481]